MKNRKHPLDNKELADIATHLLDVEVTIVIKVLIQILIVLTIPKLEIKMKK